MTSNNPGPCCSTGFRHEGEPTGKMIKIDDNIDAYLATPPDGKPNKDAGILFVTDVFGLWNNSKLLADEFAKNGYTCLIPDLFNGDVCPWPRPPGFDIMKWFAEGSNGNDPHGPAQVDPITQAGIRALKDLGFTKIGAAGYCFGAKYVVRNFKEGIQVGYIAHPSFVTDEELRGITGPLAISAAQTDVIFPLDKRVGSEKILGELPYPWQINLFSGTEHGFTIRGDISKRDQRFAKEQAFSQAVAWFDYYLI